MTTGRINQIAFDRFESGPDAISADGFATVRRAKPREMHGAQRLNLPKPSRGTGHAGGRKIGTNKATAKGTHSGNMPPYADHNSSNSTPPVYPHPPSPTPLVANKKGEKRAGHTANCRPTADGDGGDYARPRVERPYWKGRSPFVTRIPAKSRLSCFGHVTRRILERFLANRAPVPGGSLTRLPV